MKEIKENSIYSMKFCGIHNFELTKKKVKCAICSQEFVKLRNLCHSGRFDSIFVCESCFKDENKKDEIENLIQEKILKYSNQAKEILDHFKEKVLICAYAEPCCETIGSYISKIRRLNLEFNYEIKNTGYSMQICFNVLSFNDFMKKWNIINQAKTKCGCAIMYGDSCIADVSVTNFDKQSTIDVNFEVLHNFTDLKFDGDD